MSHQHITQRNLHADRSRIDHGSAWKLQAGSVGWAEPGEMDAPQEHPLLRRDQHLGTIGVDVKSPYELLRRIRVMEACLQELRL